MATIYEGDMVRFTGICDSTEAETLLIWLEGGQNCSIDLSKLEAIHPAVLQVLMARRPKAVVPPEDTNLSAWLLPLFGPT